MIHFVWLSNYFSYFLSFIYLYLSLSFQESIVDVRGLVKKVEGEGIASCTQKDAELHAVEVGKGRSLGEGEELQLNLEGYSYVSHYL